MVRKISSESIAKWSTVAIYAFGSAAVGSTLYRGYNEPRDQVSVAIAVPALIFLGLGTLALYVIPSPKTRTDTNLSGPRWAVSLAIMLFAATVIGILAAYTGLVFLLSSFALRYLMIGWAAAASLGFASRLVITSGELLVGTVVTLCLVPMAWSATLAVRDVFNSLFAMALGGIPSHRFG